MDTTSEHGYPANTLSQSAPLLQVLLAKSADMITVSDRDGRITYASPATERVSGYTVAEFVARHPFETIHPDDRPACQAIFKRLLTTPGLCLDAQHRIYHKDGTWHWVEGTFISLFDDPAVNGLIATIRDITVRKRYELNAAFLADLGAEFARLASPDDLLQAVGEQIKRYFGVSRLTFLEINEQADQATVIYDNHETDQLSGVGVHRLSAYVGAAYLRELKAGQPIVINDLHSDPLTAACAEAYQPFAIRAQLIAPHISEGHVDFVIALQHATPYTWRADEIELVRELSDRLYLRLERARADALLRESEEKYRTLFHSIDEGFCIVEMLFDDSGKPVDYRFLEINPLFERMTGLEQALGKTARELVQNLEDFWIETYGAVALTGKAQRFEHRSEAMGRWFEVYTSRFGRPESRRVAIVFKDITQRKQAEQALRESENRFRNMADHAPVMVWVTEPDAKCTFLSQSWYEFTGQTPETGLNFGWLNATHPDDREHSERIFFTANQAQQPFRLEYRLRRHDGEYRWALDSAQPRFGKNNDFLGYIGSVIDITERKHAEAELERLYAGEQAARLEAEAALRVRDQFLSIASHELRTPLTALLGYASMLHKRLVDERISHEQNERMAALIVAQTKRLNALIEQLLDVTRIQRGQFHIDPQSLDIGALVEHVITEFRLSLPTEHSLHSIELIRPDAAVILHADARQIEQVIQNLLGNAVKYSPGGGHVFVRLAQQDSLVVIEVEDQGIGIPLAAQTRLFEPFYRADNVQPAITGFGIGLYVVHQIVHAHGGRIELSSSEGVGSRFRVLLPLR
jgi:PAS domain S-box-containing protein